jgi:hypothetical protein
VILGLAGFRKKAEGATVPDASGKPVPTSVTVTLNSGRETRRIATIPIEENEAAALASLLAQAVRVIHDDWVYLSQLEALARKKLCKK